MQSDLDNHIRGMLKAFGIRGRASIGSDLKNVRVLLDALTSLEARAPVVTKDAPCRLLRACS
jgi:hypothetical protein